MTLSDLTASGFMVSLDIACQLRVRPAKRLTPALRQAIKANRTAIYRAVLERDWRAWIVGRSRVDGSKWRAYQ